MCDLQCISHLWKIGLKQRSLSTAIGTSDGQTNTQVIIYLSNAMNCIGLTISKNNGIWFDADIPAVVEPRTWLARVKEKVGIVIILCKETSFVLCFYFAYFLQIFQYVTTIQSMTAKTGHGILRNMWLFSRLVGCLQWVTGAVDNPGRVAAARKCSRCELRQCRVALRTQSAAGDGDGWRPTLCLAADGSHSHIKPMLGQLAQLL